jgi:tight adherence protein C
MFAFLILGLFFLGVCVVAVVKGATLRRVRTVERLGTIEDYGYAVEAPGPVSPTQPSRNGIADLVERIGAFFARNFGGIREADLRVELMAAGIYTMSPRTLLGYRVLAALLLPVLVLLAGGLSILSVLLALAMIVAGWMVPMVLLRRKARARLHEIDRRLPDLIDLLVVTIEAGMGFSAALRMATDNLIGPLSDELRLTLQEQTMGLAVDDALANLMRRADTPAVRSFVRSMAQGERLGISMGQIMRNLALEMRKRRRKAAEEQAQKAPIKMLFPLVFLIFPSLFIVLMVPALLQLISSLGSG